MAYLTMITWKNPKIQRPEVAFSRLNKRAIIACAALFFGANVLAGFLHHDGLFFTCYPTFSYSVDQDQKQLLVFRNEEPLAPEIVKADHPKERFQYWEYQIIKLFEAGDTVKGSEKLEALLEPCRAQLDAGETLRVYLMDGSIIPDSGAYIPMRFGPLIYQTHR